MSADRRVARRTVFGAGLATTVAALAGCGDGKKSPAAGETPGAGASADSLLPAEAGASASGQAQGVSTAPYSGKLVDTMKRYLVPISENPKHPGYAGAVVHVNIGGRTVTHAAVGDALRYGAGAVELPARSRVAMRP